MNPSLLELHFALDALLALLVVVGAVFALAAYLALRSGLAALKPAQLVPERALRGLRRDAETLKEGLMP